MTDRPHPDTQIGRLPCTCGNDHRPAAWHISPCEIKLVHLESLTARDVATDNPEAHGADE